MTQSLDDSMILDQFTTLSSGRHDMAHWNPSHENLKMETFCQFFFQSPHLITVDHLWSSINSSLSILVICLLQQISKHPLTSSPALTSRVSALTATAPKEVLLHRGAAKAEPLGDIGINDQCAPLRIRNHNIHIDLHGLIYYIPN